MINVLVVDDSAYNRTLLAGMLESSPRIKVVGTAADGEEAIEKAVRLKPDFVTLDLEMPRMDGFTFLRWLMRAMPTPVLVVSSRADDKSVLMALEFGAVDFLPKPVGPGAGVEELKKDLVDKVLTFAALEMSKVSSSVALLEAAAKEKPPPAREAAAPSAAQVDVVAVGASTGGPPAIQAIVTKLPEGFPAAVAVSQHMPPRFTRFFAERLDKLSRIRVKEAGDGEPLLPGHVYIAPGGMHMTFVRREGGMRVRLTPSEPGDKYVPSIDAMMRSAAMNFGKRALGVVLTGMGSDGKEGLGLIKGMGGRTFAESKETAVIYGMPKEAFDAGVVDSVIPLGRMAGEIIKACG